MPILFNWIGWCGGTAKSRAFQSLQATIMSNDPIAKLSTETDSSRFWIRRSALLSSHQELLQASVLFSYRRQVHIPHNNLTMANKNPLFPILWIILLIWVAYPVAMFCAGIWIMLQVRKDLALPYNATPCNLTSLTATTYHILLSHSVVSVPFYFPPALSFSSHSSHAFSL